MKESWQSKVKCWFRRIIKKLSGHEYGCCNKILYPCKKCKYVTGDDNE